MNIFLILILFQQLSHAAREKVVFGGAETFPAQIFKDKNAGKGLIQTLSKMLLEDSNYYPSWIEMTQLSQNKEISKNQLFCRFSHSIKENIAKERKNSEIEDYVQKDLAIKTYKVFTTHYYSAINVDGYITIKNLI